MGSLEGLIWWVLGVDGQVLEGSAWRFALGWGEAGWMWVLVGFWCVGVGLWSYRGLSGRRWARVMLGGVRAMVLMLLVLLLARPGVVVERERVEGDRVVVLVDRSGSMGFEDELVDGERVSRDAAMKRTLADYGQVLWDEGFLEDREVVWLGFDREVYGLDGGDVERWGEAVGEGTLLGGAIERGLGWGDGDGMVAGLLVLSDGASGDVLGGRVGERLREAGVGVWAVGFGSADGPVDLALGGVDGPRRGFVRDQVLVGAEVLVNGGGEDFDEDQVVVRLVDLLSGEVMDEVLGEVGRVVLRGWGEVGGVARWRVEVAYAGGGEELLLDNNQRVVEVELVDRPLRVLYVEGYPRWGYRYLVNLLVRQERVLADVLLVSAERGFVQEGEGRLGGFVGDSEALGRYDVLVVGDVESGFFSQEQMRLVGEAVSRGELGLLWWGGERGLPVSYERSVLADLLPMREPGGVVGELIEGGDMKLWPTEVAGRLGLLEMGEELGELPGMYWAQRMGELKAGAEVLADGRWGVEGEVPVLVRMRYGAGEVMYVGSDEMWRWRFGRGDVYGERFWMPLLLMLGRAGLEEVGEGIGGGVVLEVGRREVLVGEPVMVSLGGVGEGSGILDGEDVDVEVVDFEGDVVGGFVLSGDGDGGWSGLWRPVVGGEFGLRVGDGVGGVLAESGVVRVGDIGGERVGEGAAYERLRDLAKGSGGALLEREDLLRLDGLLPRRARRVAADMWFSLWDGPLALGLVLVLLGVEWVGRKMLNLA